MSEFANGELVSGSDGVAVGGSIVDFKQFQNIYNAITGRSEYKGGKFSLSHKLKIEDIEQLIIKIDQIVNVKHCLGKSCSVTVYHVNDKKESFSSPDRFKLYNSSTVSPVENVNLEFKFAIMIPETKEAENYIVKINLHSRIGQFQKNRHTTEYFPGIFRFFGQQTGTYRVDYVNYIIAREIITAIDDWYDGVKKSEENKSIKFLQKYSHYIPKLFLISSILYLTFSAIMNSEYLIGLDPSIMSLFKGLCFTLATIWAVGLITNIAGSKIETAIDSIYPLSYVCLNRGDEQAIEKYNNSWGKKIRLLSYSFILPVLLNLLSSFIWLKIKVS